VCIGGGPSLTPEDVDYCRGKARVIAINDAFKLAPWADVLYACDGQWWGWHKGVPDFKGLKYGITLKPHQRDFGVGILKQTADFGLEKNPSGLRTGKNSGYQAMNLAVHLGARTIILLGYDMQVGPNKETHWFGDHPVKTLAIRFPNYVKSFTTIVEPLKAIGVTVWNCSRQTALKQFPRAVITDVLPEVFEVAS
jgi:hypothetical protein